MKKPIKLIILIIILTGGLILGSLSTKMRVKNIFDEIYYSTLDYIRGKEPKMSLEKIQGIKRVSAIDKELGINSQPITWEYHQKGKKMLVTVSKERVRLSTYKKLELDTELKVSVDYDLVSKIVNPVFSIIEGGDFIRDKKEVQSYLNKYKISQKELNKAVDELMYKTFFVDWIASNKGYTKFNSSNFGEFKLDEKK